jgi:GT2 family glycosyltransferase
MRIDISVVILSWNSEQHIERCVSSVIQSLLGSELGFEIIIVDNGSTDSTIGILNEIVESWPSYVNPIYFKKNTGTTHSRNIALKQAQGEWIAILDSDVEVDFGIFELLVSKLKEDLSIGLIAPKLVYPSGLLQKSTDQFPTILTKFKRFFFLKQIERAERLHFKDDSTREVDYAISAFWIFPHKILQDVGFLDEKIFYAPEDVDYCLRIWKCNYKILYEPSVSAVHHAQEISRGFKLNKATLDHAKGLLYYFIKHKYLIIRPKVSQCVGYLKEN